VGREDSVQGSHAVLHRFLFQFLIAGLTGIMLGASPFDWQLSNSYFVVAHFHYVIVGGILFTIFGAFYYWFPKMSGRMYSETLAKWHFWLFLIGFHLTFDFMHIPGMLGMPRRIYTYEPGRGWEIWNLIVTIGVFFRSPGCFAFVFNLLWSAFKGEPAGNDPWDAWTLEWSTTSPPPEYNFARFPLSGAGARFGTSSIRKIRIGSTNRQENSIEQRSDYTTLD
jgi:cytochrome c oxidase subunit 1